MIDTWQTEDGLPSATVEAILQTRDGYLWLGTRGGLARFDGARFTVFDRARIAGFSSNHVTALEEGVDNSLWVGFRQGGLHRLHDGAWEHFDTRHGLSHDSVFALHATADGVLWIGTELGVDRWDNGKISSLSNCPEFVVGIREAATGDLWILGRDGLVGFLDDACVPLPDKFTLPRRSDPELKGEGTQLLAARDGSLWLGTKSGRIFRLAEGGLMSAGDDEGPSRVSSEVLSLFGDRRGTFWVGTYEGLVRFADAVSTTFTQVDGLADSRILSLFEDWEGSLWIGTYTGLNRLKRSRFETLTVADGLTHGVIVTALEGSAGDVWIGSERGLDRYSRGTLEAVPTADSRPLGSVRSLLEDSRGKLWVGTKRGLFHLDDDALKRYDKSGYLARAYVQAFRESASGDLWVGTSNEVFRLGGEGVLEVVDLGGRAVRAIHEDRQGDVWFATEVGLYRRRGSSLSRYPPEEDSRTYFIREIRQDPSGVLWLGTIGSGLLRFEDGRFTEVDTSHGLYDDHVWHSAEDARGILWMCSDRGLFTAVRQEIEELKSGARTSISSLSYGLTDGLKTLECNGTGEPAGFKAADGRLWFTTASGVVIVDPERFERNQVIPTVLVEEVKIDGVALDGVALDGSARKTTDSLEVPTGARQIEIRFTATSLRDPPSVRFRYRLEDYDRDWIEGSRRWVIYGNLAPGSYRFRVMASNNDGLWNEQGASLQIVVPPPFWRTWWAFTLYGMALAAIITATLRAQRAKLEEQKTKLEQERAVSRQLRAVDKLKDEFLANTSHELRTPLHGIIGLAESLADGSRGELTETAKSDLGLIVASGQRLASLVTDILDYSQLTHKSLKLRQRAVDLRTLTEVVLALQKPLAASKDLELRNAVPADLPAAHADEARLEQILHNLVGNAVKFTEAGRVEISARALRDRLTLTVEDTGIGIAEGHLKRIFEAFTQADLGVQRTFGGTGLGLTVTRELVELHGGRIWLESVVGKGTRFFVDLPISAREAEVDQLADPRPVSRLTAVGLPTIELKAAVTDTPRGTAPSTGGAGDRRLLVVDDEPINLQVLSNHLASAGYEVVLASSGPEALRRLEEQSFDLVVLDVMMPGMSGYEVCQVIREQNSLERLPVVFLTAKNQIPDLVAGLAAGGNDYLTKPIGKDELLARVRTHLELLETHRQLARLMGDLEKRNTELAQFNYTVAHDLRNPLTTILNFLGLARRDAATGHSERLEDDLDRLDGAAQKLRRLLDELFELSSVGVRTNPATEMAFGDLVREALAKLAEPIVERRVEVEVEADLPVVRGDLPRFREALVHLLTNAVEYLGDQRSPRIKVGVREAVAGSEPVVFYVRDNGKGIEARYHEKVFGLFERLDPEVSEGTGVGLTMVKRIVEAHGGRVWVESGGLGHGSTFCLVLPNFRSTARDRQR